MERKMLLKRRDFIKKPGKILSNKNKKDILMKENNNREKEINLLFDYEF